MKPSPMRHNDNASMIAPAIAKASHKPSKPFLFNCNGLLDIVKPRLTINHKCKKDITNILNYLLASICHYAIVILSLNQ